MSVSLSHVLSQGPVLVALGRAALSTVRPTSSGTTATAPGPWLEATLPPRPEALIRDYVRHVGGDPGWYRGIVPAHLFPQWGFPLAAEALSKLHYTLARVMNAGCRIEQHAALPAGEPLIVRARIESIDDDGRRAIVTQRVVTGTREVPDAITADLRAYLPLDTKRDGGAKKARPTVPANARELAYLRIRRDAGLDFAKLTGDFNPIHWVPAYARAAGFRGTILHGFATLARAIEAVNRARFAGDPRRLATVDVRFSRPLPLPATVGVYVDDDNGLWVGDAPGGGAYLEGRYSAHERA